MRADVIIKNARVYTVDAARPQAEAVGVQGEEIIFVGSNKEAASWIGAETCLIDGRGRTLMPGFIDSHFHLMWGALGLAEMQLEEARTLEALAEEVAAYKAADPEQTWLVGRGLRYVIPTPEEPLTRHHLDAIELERPLLITAYDYHTMWANTAALRVANLLEGAETGPGSEIVLGGDGLATGELREPAAYNLLLKHRPKISRDQRLKLLKDGLQWLASLGITSIHNMDGNPKQAALYAALEERGELPLRIYMPYDIVPETALEELEQQALSMKEQFQSEMVRAGSVKFFMDGVLESYTALLVDPYADKPETVGESLFSAAHFAEMAIEADRLGLQVVVHCCGDGAVRRTLDGYAAAVAQNGRRDSRHRIEHIELLHPDDEHRFAELGVIASMQPLHAPMLHKEHDVWPSRAGTQRWQNSFAWRTIRDTGAKLVFGSDWPVVSPSPFLGLDDALNRRPWGAEGDAHYHQTLEEVIASYTRDAAYAEFQEDQKGQIKVGMWADLVLLSEDIFDIDPAEIGEVGVVLTMCNGRVVYERAGL